MRKALSSTLKRFRDGLDGHPVYASELSRANRLYEMGGDNNQYLGLEKSDPIGVSTLELAAGVTAGSNDRAERNGDPEPDHIAARQDQPTSPPIQIDALSEVAPPAAIASRQTAPQVSVGDVDRAVGLARPAATPADPIQPDSGSDRSAR